VPKVRIFGDVVRPLQAFLEMEAAGGIVLLVNALVASMGFTVALFIAGLAFDGATELRDQAKVGILFGSLAAGLVGYLVLRAERQVAAER
jgi:NhaA family Na+:H+ antiporter